MVLDNNSENKIYLIIIMFLFLINFASASVNIETSTYTNNGILGLTATENLQNFIFTTTGSSDIVYYSNDSALNFYESDSEILIYPSLPSMTNNGEYSYFNDYNGFHKLYQSTNKGINWVEKPIIINGENVNFSTTEIALSSDGQYIYILPATYLSNGYKGILKSDNYGDNFTLYDTDNMTGIFIKCSDNGKYIIINKWDDVLQQQSVYYSDDYGENFNIVVENSEIPLNNVYNIDISNDGNTLMYVTGNNAVEGWKGGIFISYNKGEDWIERGNYNESDFYNAFMSGNGRYFLVSEYSTGKIYISENYGLTFSLNDDEEYSNLYLIDGDIFDNKYFYLGGFNSESKAVILKGLISENPNVTGHTINEVDTSDIIKAIIALMVILLIISAFFIIYKNKDFDEIMKKIIYIVGACVIVIIIYYLWALLL